MNNELEPDVKAALARAQRRVAVKYADLGLLVRAWATLKALAEKATKIRPRP